MTIPAIIQLAAEAWHSTPEAICGSRRDLHHVRARRLACYLIREHAELSYEWIGQQITKDHGTVMHHCRTMEVILQNGSAEARICREVMQRITDTYPTPTPPSAGR